MSKSFVRLNAKGVLDENFHYIEKLLSDETKVFIRFFLRSEGSVFHGHHFVAFDELARQILRIIKDKVINNKKVLLSLVGYPDAPSNAGKAEDDGSVKIRFVVTDFHEIFDDENDNGDDHDYYG